MVVTDILQLYLQVPVVLTVLLRQVQSLFIVAGSATHTDSSLHVKVYLTVFTLCTSNRELL